MSLGAVLSNHDRCVTYNISHDGITLFPKKRTDIEYRLEICLKSRVRNARVTET